MGDKLNERQVRELLPLAGRHGHDAAVTVYRTVAETDGIQVTAALLHGTVSILPPGRFDPAEATEQIRAYLTGNLGSQARHNASAVEAFTRRRRRCSGHCSARLAAEPCRPPRTPTRTVRRMIASVRIRS